MKLLLGNYCKHLYMMYTTHYLWLLKNTLLFYGNWQYRIIFFVLLWFLVWITVLLLTKMDIFHLVPGQWTRKNDKSYRSTIQTLIPSTVTLNNVSMVCLFPVVCAWSLEHWGLDWTWLISGALPKSARAHSTIVCYVFLFLEGRNGHDKAISTLSAFPWQPQWAYLPPRLMGLQHSNKGGVLRQTCGCRTWGNVMESGVYQTK